MQRCAGCAFDIEGVAPEASVYMYRVFGCDGGESGCQVPPVQSERVGQAISEQQA
jgi:hypothetical protein